MADNFQRLLTMSDAQPLALNAQAALGAVRPPRRSQFSLLVRHFLERFFNHETASPDGDAKTRLVQIAFAAGLPGLIVAVYLWPVYHPIRGWPPGQPSQGGPPPYWLQVNHHFFFVLYSFVSVGIVTVFEWDMFFPDLLDMWVLKSLPIAEGRVFAARVAAIAIFTAGFLFDANIFAILVLPSATDPPNLGRFLLAHLLAVGGSGLFAAAFVLALQGMLLSLLGERLFRKISLLMQGLTITALVMLMLLFPVFSGVVPALLKSSSYYALLCPPFWFLGIYQSIMEGQAALPVYDRLASVGSMALLAGVLLAVVAYPLAYLRRVRQLVEGPGSRPTRNWLGRPLNFLLHVALVRRPVCRAVFHFISQTVLRVPRYRIYLVLYGGVGLSVVAASLLRFSVAHEQVRIGISPSGIRAALGIVAFWVIAGLRMAFVSSGNRQGNWAFRIVHGRPPCFSTALELLGAAKIWILVCAGTVTLAAGTVLRIFSPPGLLTWPATAGQIIVAGGMCLLLTDLLLLSVTTVAFTGEPQREQPNLAFTLLKYFTFFPFVSAIPMALEPWVQESARHMVEAIVVIAALHLALEMRHRATIRLHCDMAALEDDEEDFPMKLGLRY
ncbi:MAG TPA: hypothetical protein VH308_06720 [Terracidiphilus sp.]|jgi:hypothetical protein|nr:hypothetical protein [Terracidiphilus sp.]